MSILDIHHGIYEEIYATKVLVAGLEIDSKLEPTQTNKDYHDDEKDRFYCISNSPFRLCFDGSCLQR